MAVSKALHCFITINNTYCNGVNFNNGRMNLLFSEIIALLINGLIIIYLLFNGLKKSYSLEYEAI